MFTPLWSSSCSSHLEHYPSFSLTQVPWQQSLVETPTQELKWKCVLILYGFSVRVFLMQLADSYNYILFRGLGWLSPLGMSATSSPVVPELDDRQIWSIWWNENCWGKPKYSKKTCPNAILYTTNPTWPDLQCNLGCCSGKLATNHLSYDMAQIRATSIPHSP